MKLTQPISVTKEIMFECAHMLSFYEGPCSNLHGHSYKAQVTVIGVPLNDPAVAGNHMVIDFSVLKQIISGVIMQCDHAVLFSTHALQDRAEKSLYAWACEHNMKHVVMPTRTTCEAMATYFQNEICKEMAYYYNIEKPYDVKVKLWETTTSFAEV